MTGFDINKVMALLPHRYPFLLVDRVLETDGKEFLSAAKNVSINEPFFQGHFPGQPVMPGVLIMEALAQTTALLGYVIAGDDDGGVLYMLTGMDKCRFREQVVPGDQLVLNVTLKKSRRGLSLFECRALVDGAVVAEADIMCSAQERKQ